MSETLMGYQGEIRHSLKTGASSNLVAYYKMDELTGTTVTDASGNGNNGTLSDSAQWVYRGKYDGCIGFDGAATNVDTGMGSPFAASDDITVSAWVMFHDVAGAYNVICSDYDNATVTGWSLFFSATANQGLAVANFQGGGNSKITETDDNSPAVGVWHHAICVVYGDGRQPRLWLNGVEHTGTRNSNPGNVTQLNQSARNVLIGTEWTGASATTFWDGLIDEVSIWDRGLNEAEVLYVYRNRGDLQINPTEHMAYIDTWSVDVAQGIEEVTDFDASTPVKSKTYAYSQATVTGSCSGTLNLVSGYPTPQELIIDELIGSLNMGYAQVVLKNDSLSLYGPVRQSRVSLGARVDDKQSFSMDFTMDGDLTYARKS